MVIGILVLVALIFGCLGAGRAILTSAGATSRPGINGAAVLTGLALLTWLGGWLVLAGAYSEPMGWALIGLGCAAILAQLVRARRLRSSESLEPRPPDGIAMMLGLLSLVLVIGRALGELAVPFMEVTDDWPSYWHFPRLLLESGSFIEPFSLRRLTALGSAAFAQSFFWPGFQFAANGMADAVLGQLVIWAAARALPDALATQPQPAWRGEALALAALLVSLTILGQSSQPTLLPMAGALVLILLTRRMTVASNTSATVNSGVRAAIAWGLVAAWLIGLRTSNVVFPAGLWLVSALVATRKKDRDQALRLALAGLATVVGLLPWCLELWRSSGTPLYPLFAGNYRFEGNLYSVPLDGPGLIALIGDRLWVSRVWILAGIGLIAALRPGVRLLSIQVVAALLLLVTVSAAGTNGLDAITIHRLSAPFLAAGVVFLTAAIVVAEPAPPVAGRAAPRWNFQPLALWAGLALWFALPVALPLGAWPFPYSNRSIFTYHGSMRLQAAELAWRLGLRIEDFHRDEYGIAQALLPANARLVSAAERPFLFRFDEQVIHTLDFPFPGVVSPAPGMPFFQGPEPLAKYFRDLGYTHLAFSPKLFANTRQQFGDENRTRYICFSNFDELRPYFLDFMVTAEDLEQLYPVIYRAEELVVIDLSDSRRLTGASAVQSLPHPGT